MNTIANNVEQYLTPRTIKVRLKSDPTKYMEIQCLRQHIESRKSWNRRRHRYSQQRTSIPYYVLNIKSDTINGEFMLTLGMRLQLLFSLVFDIEMSYRNDSMQSKVFDVYNEKQDTYSDMCYIKILRLIEFTFYCSSIDKPTREDIIVTTKEMALKDNDIAI